MLQINFLKKLFDIIVILSITLILIGCSPMKWTTLGHGGRMRIDYDLSNQTKEQIDSICLSESISSNLKKHWSYLPFQDEETEKKYEKYMYIQKMDSLEILFLITKEKNDKSNDYNIVKRTTYELIK